MGERLNARETYSGETGDIDTGEGSRDTRSGFVEVTEPFETVVGDRYASFLGGGGKVESRDKAKSL